MTEREARIAAIRERWRKATTDGPANEFLGEAWNDIPWLLAHLQAAERDRDAARGALEQLWRALNRAEDSRGVFSCTEYHDIRCPKSRADSPDKWNGEWRCECGREELDAAADTAEAFLTPTPPPEEDAR